MVERTSILVVEDEEKIRSALTDFLEFHKFDVTEAADGLEAERKAVRFNFARFDASENQRRATLLQVASRWPANSHHNAYGKRTGERKSERFEPWCRRLYNQAVFA